MCRCSSQRPPGSVLYFFAGVGYLVYSKVLHFMKSLLPSCFYLVMLSVDYVIH